jgi:serine/threonine protein kinase/tetratricopeptide (TPR) repeat protein
MGTVYLAVDRKHNRRVAIKVLPPELAAALGPERFLREIRIAAQLNHPHILPLHDSGTAAGVLYYVMPHVEGESLRHRLSRDERISIDEALEITRQVADALAYAHAAGIVHRDVKPENILLTGYPLHDRGAAGGRHALLADFGVAKAFARRGAGTDHPGDLRTDSGLPIGTLAYASPEQAAGSREIDSRSDLYSLGCVLYEMLVGRTAGEAPSASQILEKRFAIPPPAAHSLRSEVPPWIDGVLNRATALNPAERYPTAAEFRDALTVPSESAWVTAPVPVRPTTVPAVLGSRRPQLLWMIAGAAALAIAGAAVAFLPHRTVSFDPKRVVVAGFENRTGDSTLDPVADIAADYVARGLAATRLMHEVYDARSMAREAREPVPRGAATGLALAKRVGAGTVLWGSYYGDGDSLHIEAQLLDGASGKLIVPLEPSIGLLRDRTRVVEILRQRVMAGFAVVLGSEFDTWKAASLPPTYDAYQQMLAGAGSEFDFAAAAEHYRRAAALDTGFTGARTAAAVALWLKGDCQAVDSIAKGLDTSPGRLPPLDRGQLELASAGCRGDTDAAMAAARSTLEASPRSIEMAILATVIAVEHSRPRGGLEMLRLVDPKKTGTKGFLLGVYDSWLRYTYHMLGEYQQELTVGRSDESGASDVYSDQASALAALGRVEQAERLAVGMLPDRHSSNDPWPAPMATTCAALELRAHGHPDAAQRVLERVIAWYGVDGVNDATREDYPCSRPHFSVFYYAGRWDEARAGYQHMLADDSTSIKAHAALGALAVRRGDPAEADRMDTWLASRSSSANATYARARLAALRGDGKRAVELLRQAFDQGLKGRMFLHLDPDFESLRHYSPYSSLIHPKL